MIDGQDAPEYIDAEIMEAIEPGYTRRRLGEHVLGMLDDAGAREEERTRDFFGSWRRPAEGEEE